MPFWLLPVPRGMKKSIPAVKTALRDTEVWGSHSREKCGSEERTTTSQFMKTVQIFPGYVTSIMHLHVQAWNLHASISGEAHAQCTASIWVISLRVRNVEVILTLTTSLTFTAMNFGHLVTVRLHCGLHTEGFHWPYMCRLAVQYIQSWIKINTSTMDTIVWWKGVGLWLFSEMIPWKAKGKRQVGEVMQMYANVSSSDHRTCLSLYCTFIMLSGLGTLPKKKQITNLQTLCACKQLVWTEPNLQDLSCFQHQKHLESLSDTLCKRAIIDPLRPIHYRYEYVGKPFSCLRYHYTNTLTF